MRLGIFGGTFDPVHYGHLLLAECCREGCGLDMVWFVPAGVPPHKQNRALTGVGQRIEMLELAIGGNLAFSVCRYEAERGTVAFTVDTLEQIHAEKPEDELFLLLGADMAVDLPNWRSPARICELALPVAVRRSGSRTVEVERLRPLISPDRFEAMRRLQVEMPEVGTSSSEVRGRVEKGQSIRYRVPRAVELYIETHGLYSASR